MRCNTITSGILLALCLVIGFNGIAQTGNYFVTNLSPPDERIDPRSLGITQDDRGVIYFTNKNGILEYEGNNWRLINTPGSVYTLISSGREIFAGGAFGFGKLAGSEGKATQFQLISGSPNVFSSVKLNDKIFFCNEREIFSFDVLSNQLDKASIITKADNSFEELHIVGGKLLVSTEQAGLQSVKDGALAMPEFTLPADESLMFSIPVNGGNDAILGMEDGKIFRFSPPNIIKPLIIQDGEYLEHHVLINGTLVSNDLLALGTLRGGVLFVDVNSGETKEIIDYSMGLPDNDVMALFTDKNRGVWVAHEYGFSRIAPFLPFRSYNHYPGLSGNLLCVREIDGRLFAGTSLGLYYLKTEEQYEEVEVIVKPAQTIMPDGKVTVTPVEQKEQGRKKLFAFKKARKNAEEKVNDDKKAADQAVAQKPKYIPAVKRKERVLKSRQYVYEKINGIDGKVTQILSIKGRTIIAGLGGAFELNATKVESIFQEPVRYVFHSPTLDQIFISTYDDRTVSLSLAGKNWNETHYTDTLHDYISYIFEDELQNIWFCGKTQIYKMELVDAAITSFQALPISNPQFDETVGLALGNEVFIAASGQFNRYDESKGFVKYDSLPGPKKYFASAGYFWFNDSHRWRTISKKLQSLKMEWLGLFPNLRFLAPLNDGTGLWLVTANNELYKFTNPPDAKDYIYYPLFLKDVRGQEIKLLKEKSLRMEQSEGGLFFEFTQPNYTGFRATEFRYRVTGLSEQWSTWSNVNNVVSLPFLPPGEYQLAVQSRDIFGRESNEELVSFEVLPYYWKRWWFYALEFTFFTIMVMISIKLGRGDERYRVVSQILSLLTVVLLIQFIETGISSLIEFKSSPVIQFFIQLGIALVVFPIESKFQQFMRKASGLKYN